MCIRDRFSTGPYRREYGHNTPHQNGRCVATISGRPTCQPNRHHMQTTSSWLAMSHNHQRYGCVGVWCNGASCIAESCHGVESTHSPGAIAMSLDPALRQRIDDLLAANHIVLLSLIHI